MINEDILKGKWKEIKGEIRSKWGKITDDELEQAKGNSMAISGLIQQRYGQRREEADRGLEGIVSRFADRSEDVKRNLRDDTDHSTHA